MKEDKVQGRRWLAVDARNTFRAPNDGLNARCRGNHCGTVRLMEAGAGHRVGKDVG